MKKTLLALCLLGALGFSTPADAKIEHLLPKPQQVTSTGGASFALGRAVTVTDPTNCAYLTRFLTETGCAIENGASATITVTLGAVDGAYDFELDGFPNEAYSLEINENAVKIVAVTPTGVIRAAQTLSQLALGYEGTAALEALTMKDWPAFKLRGFMHDVGRSFVSVEQLKKQIDAMAKFKVNTFHWHFTENQAWRFEVKAYPQLTSAASMTRFAGQYYTQAQCKEIQDYAYERGMVIIPEIDMPGHSQAFTRAMGHDMQTDQGVAELKVIIKEVCQLFDKVEYVHIGGDEVTITYPQFLETMIAEVKKYDKKVAVWNPINGVNVANLDADMTQMWSSRGAKIAGKASIDCRYNYTNHFDVFADLVGIYKSNIYYQDKGTAEVPGFLSCPWNDRKTPTEADILRQNNVYAATIATAERAWIGGGKQYIEKGGTTLPNSGEEYDEFADWERRFIFHKNTSLSSEAHLIPYVKQSNVRWKITDGFPNGGDATKKFPPETEGLKDSYTYNGQTYGVGAATGAGIYLRHTWGNNVIPTYFSSNPSTNTTAYAWTYVYSPVAQKAGAFVEFYNYGRSEVDQAPPAGKWDHCGSTIYLNDVKLTPPVWKNTGKSINHEVDLMNENFTARPPLEVQLKEGWNKVFIKLPFNPSGVRLQKWMFTFVLTDTEGKDALEGLIYSPNQYSDEGAEVLSAKISEIRQFINSKMGDGFGQYPSELANDINAKIAAAEATLNASMSADERAAQLTALDAAFNEFKELLANTIPNGPELSEGDNVFPYLFKDQRQQRYATSTGAGGGLIGNTTASDASKWKFVLREDNKYDIINIVDNSFISPTAANNTQLMTTTAQPAKGWDLTLVGDGFVTITSGTTQFNQTQGGQNFKVFNWGDGTNTTDGGCLYQVISTEMPEIPEVSSLPFTTTTIENGEFAAGTQWYTMQIGASGFYLSDNGSANHIALNKTNSEYEAADLWCFVGSEADGVQIYNKQAGVSKVLASSTTMTGTTGGSTYPTLQPVNALPSGYKDRWDFTESTDLTDGNYIALHGYASYAINNRDNKLAFWTGGKDAGSTVVIKMVETEALIDLVNGEYTASNANRTWFSLWESRTNNGLTLGTGANNMEADGNNISIHSGSVKSCTVTITAPEDYIISSISFDFKHNTGDSGESITIDGKTYSVTSQIQHIEVSNLENRTVSFVQYGNNKGVTYSNFKVTLKKGIDPYASKIVFPTAGQSIPYRIPAIAQASNGNLIAVADYRYSKADIGSGNLDLRYSISTDKGQTWGDIKTLISYSHNGGGNLHTGYGDPCIVADRESNRVMVLSCSGNVMFPNGQRNHHQGIARFYSEDNGQTWSKPYDLSDSIYAMFDNCTIGTARSMFVGSGKISQSKTIKVGDYYRIYCAILFKDNNGTNKNYALYSDNFGETWSVLGGINVAPIPSGADEPKAEELPDGSVLVSSRVNGGRYFNVFHYTDVEKGEGEWTVSTFSGADNNGTASPGYTCNGEILIAPVKRTADNKPMYLLLQSVPFGSGRQNVGFYYKELSAISDFYTGAGVAKDWDGNYQVSFTTSCYSTMVQMDNDSIAFLYEENEINSGYDIVYRSFSIDQITDSAYVSAEVDVPIETLIAASIDGDFADLANFVGNLVGNLTEDGYASIQSAYETCDAEPTMENYKAFQASISSAETVQLSGAIKYRLRNKQYPTKYLVINPSKMTIAVLNESNEKQLVSFVSNEDGTWKILGEAVNGYVGKTGANETEIPVGTNAANYLVVSNIQGESYMKCTTPTGSHPAIHAAGDNVRLVPWTTDADASRWFIEPTDIATDIEFIKAASAQPEMFYDLQGRPVKTPKDGLYVTNRKRKVLVK